MTINNTANMDTSEKPSITEVSSIPVHANLPETKHLEETDSANEENLVYSDAEQEPELHARTYLALAAMFLLGFVQLVALQGPPSLLNYIGTSINATASQTWISTSLVLVQAALSPVISSACDTFQARKPILVGACLISLTGSAIAPGSRGIGRIVLAQTLIGFGFAAVPLAYSIPSEILPRKWRPIAQAIINIAASIGAILGPIIIGAFTKRDPLNGWRNFYWTQVGFWGITTAAIFIGYRPPKRHTRYDHLSLYQKLGKLDLLGSFLLTSGLSLFIAGLGLGGGLFSWTNAKVLTTIIVGLVVLVAFGIYEWRGTTTGILHHNLFRGAAGRTVALSVWLIFVEGLLFFSYLIFYPTLTQILFEQDPLLLVVRQNPFWIATGISTIIWGIISAKLRTLRIPLFLGFLFITAGIVGLATIELNDSTSAIAFASLAGIGAGSPLILIVTCVQLSTPHNLIATGTALTTCTRAVAASVFTAIYAAAFRTRIEKYLPDYIATAALKAGLPAESVPAFIMALASNDSAALPKIQGVSGAIIAVGVKALKQAYADSLRVVFIIAAPFGILACLACFFLGDLRSTMNYRVDAPVEELHAKKYGHRVTEAV